MQAKITGRTRPIFYHFQKLFVLLAPVMISGSLFQSKPPLNDRESLPYWKFLVFGRWTSFFTRRLYMTCLRLKKSYRKERLLSFQYLYTLATSFYKFLTWIGCSPLFLSTSSNEDSSLKSSNHSKVSLVHVYVVDLYPCLMFFRKTSKSTGNNWSLIGWTKYTAMLYFGSL